MYFRLALPLISYAAAFQPQTIAFRHPMRVVNNRSYRNSMPLYSLSTKKVVKSPSNDTLNTEKFLAELEKNGPRNDLTMSSSPSLKNNMKIEEYMNSNDNELIMDDNGETTPEGSALIWRGAVIGLCALWASNFPAAKMIMGEPGVDSSLYALARFSIAAMALLPGALAAIKRGAIDWETAKGAAICGSWVAFGYLGQTLGLLTTTASRSCIICSMHCVFVAVVAEWMRVSRANEKLEGREDASVFDLTRLVPAAVAVLGVIIVELKGAGGAPTIGDALSFAQPIGFGLGYLQLEELMKKKPEAALPVSAIKLCVVALASFGFFEVSPLLLNSGDISEGVMNWAPRIPDFTPILSSQVALGGILYTGLITTALALWVESIAFKQVPATDASIILTTEPLFAAAAGAYLLGETFGTSDYVGASLIVGACVLAVLLDDEASDPDCDVQDPDCIPPRNMFYK